MSIKTLKVLQMIFGAMFCIGLGISFGYALYLNGIFEHDILLILVLSPPGFSSIFSVLTLVIRTKEQRAKKSS